MDEHEKARRSATMKAWYASQTPEEEAARRQKISDSARWRHAHRTPAEKAEWRSRLTTGVRAWSANRTEAEREAKRNACTDAAVCKMWTRRRPAYKFPKGHAVMGHTPDAIERRTLQRVARASVKRIMQELVTTSPELFRDALIAGLLAEPPRSFPYLALAASYLDTKATIGDLPSEHSVDLSDLTHEQLVARAVALATRLKTDMEECVARAHSVGREAPRPLKVIDITPSSASSGPEEK